MRTPISRNCEEKHHQVNQMILTILIRSLDRLKLTFAPLIIKLKSLLSGKIAEIAMKRLFLLA